MTPAVKMHITELLLQRRASLKRYSMARFQRINLVGKVFGKLTVIELDTSTHDRRGVYWSCRCQCTPDTSNMKSIRASNLTAGRTRSCGCIRTEQLKKVRSSGGSTSHGMSGTPFYRRWAAIKAGCTNTHHPSWRHYGGKGIKLCDRWMKFENFLADIGVLGHGDRLMRMDKGKDWEPGNVKIVKGEG